MMFIWIATVISFLAFIVHSIVGDKELRMLRPKLGIDSLLIEKWIMSRAAWHWVSFDLLLIAGILLAVCVTEPVKWTPVFLKAFACCLFALGCIWLAVIAMSEKLKKKYINLGQWLLLWIIGLMVLIGSTTIETQTDATQLKDKVSAYYKLYQEREDFDQFLSFYSDKMVLEDMIGGFKIEGIEAFRDFFNWEDERFQKRDSVTLIIEHQVINENSAITSGYFTPFSWDGQEIEAMQFTTILEFNEEGKIEKHVDWINYPDYLLSQEARKNSNLWIQVNKQQ